MLVLKTYRSIHKQIQSEDFYFSKDRLFLCFLLQILFSCGELYFFFLIKKSKQKKSSAVKRKAKILEISLKLGKLEALRASQTVPSFLRLISSDFFTLFFSRRVVSIFNCLNLQNET